MNTMKIEELDAAQTLAALADTNAKLDLVDQTRRELNALQRALLDRHFFLRYGVKAGVIVRTPKDGKIYRVWGIRNAYTLTDKPRLEGCEQRKSGAFSRRVQALYHDWELFATSEVLTPARL